MPRGLKLLTHNLVILLVSLMGIAADWQMSGLFITSHQMQPFAAFIY